MHDSVPSARYSPFVMYCIYGESGSSLLTESTDSMIAIKNGSTEEQTLSTIRIQL